MQRIEVERELQKNSRFLYQKQDDIIFNSLRSSLALMYLVLMIVSIYFYISEGKDMFTSSAFIWGCITISAIFIFILLIITIDSIYNKMKLINNNKVC